MTGYLHPGYAASLAEFGAPLALPRSGGWLLRRAIAGSDRQDAMGPYPLFCCQDWRALAADLCELDPELLAVGLVADPLGEHDPALLAAAFPDRCLAFKEHFIVDLAQAPLERACTNHRRNARKALAALEVAAVTEPAAHLDEWCALYDCLIARHEIDGVSRFSRTAFAGQLAIPGIVAYRARRAGQTVGMVLWYQQGDHAYYHLAAYNEDGYQQRASFALFWRALEDFTAQGLRWLALGGGAGVSVDADDGLTRFKRGWATGTRPAWFCGRVVNRLAYDQLTAARGQTAVRFFPAYRAGASH